MTTLHSAIAIMGIICNVCIYLNMYRTITVSTWGDDDPPWFIGIICFILTAGVVGMAIMGIWTIGYHMGKGAI